MKSSELAHEEPESSLATTIILLVFVSTFATAVAVSWISIETVRRQLWQQIDERLTHSIDRSSQRLLQALGEGRSLTADLARRPASRSSLLTLIGDGSAPVSDSAAETLFRSLSGPSAERSAEIDEFLLLAPDGRTLFASDRDSRLSREQRLALAGSASGAVHAFLRPDAPAPVIAVSEPVLGTADTPAATLVGIFELKALENALATDRGDVPIHAELFDPRGQLLLHVGAPAGRDGPALPPAPVVPGAVSEYTNAAADHVIGTAIAVPSLGWALRLETPADFALAPALAVRRQLLLIDVVVVAVASLLAYLITANIVRPIEALSEGARRLASGRFDLALPETGRSDELGLLTRIVNELGRRLARSQRDLESANQRLREQNQSLLATNEVLEQLSITDGLTKLHNHRFFQDHLTREIKRMIRTGEPLSMILLDIDDFKRLNDRLGHAAGDEVLQRIAQVLSEGIRDSDLLARYGGEEFAVVASSTDLAGATVLAEKLRAAVAETPILFDEATRPLAITVSAGVAQYKGDRKKFFQATDRALYRAKAEGKNCVRVAT